MKTRMRDGTGSRSYRYLKEDVDRHGNVRIYFRRKGSLKIRITTTPGTPEFDRAYQLAYAGAPATTGARRDPVAAGTLRWLVNQYYASAAFHASARGTRENLHSALDSICEDIGDLRFALIEPRHVAALRDKKAAFPAAATLRVRALRRLFKWACNPEYALAASNPAERVSYLQSSNPEGIKPWTEADVQRYEARHPLGTTARLAFDLLLYTGVRRSDVVRLGPQMERGGKLVFSEFKGRTKNVKAHELPILKPLRASIDAMPAGHLIYLTDRQGKPYTAPAFGEWFKSRCREAAVDPKLSAHGLRKLAATRLADAGASVHQLCSWFGWMKLTQAETYTRNIDRSRLAGDAALLLEAR